MLRAYAQRFIEEQSFSYASLIKYCLQELSLLFILYYTAVGVPVAGVYNSRLIHFLHSA